jgi:hypothetical protein
MSPCPHCRGVTVVEPHAALRWVCGACGGPQVPADMPSLVRSHAELAWLVRARRARAMAFGWRAAGVMLVLTAVLGLGVGALLFIVAHVAGIVVGSVGLLSLVLGLTAFARARARDVDVRAELDEAWQRVASEVLVAGRGAEITAVELARVMRTDEASAEKLLSVLSASNRVRVDLGDDAELRYAAPLADDANDASETRDTSDASATRDTSDASARASRARS